MDLAIDYNRYETVEMLKPALKLEVISAKMRAEDADKRAKEAEEMAISADKKADDAAKEAEAAKKEAEAAKMMIKKVEAKLQRFFEIQKEGTEKNLKELYHK